MPNTLQDALAAAALAFRGYNVTNLGRTAELLAVGAYSKTVREELQRFSDICADCTQQPVDLIRRVEQRQEPGLAAYAEAVALTVAVEAAHLRLLRDVHGVDCSAVRLSLGYSLGELHAVCGSGLFDIAELVRIPLTLAADCAAMAFACTLGILFSRGPAISEAAVVQLCARITSLGGGTIGVSAILSPNTILLVGQGDTLLRFRESAAAELPQPTQLRLNEHRWPPLHTTILRQRGIADRAAVMLEKMRIGKFPPRPEVASLVTGKCNYAEHNAREILHDWVDHPQRLWDAVCEVLTADVKVVLHVGPEPNVIPATFARLSENIRQQIDADSWEGYGMRAAATLARRPWLAHLLPNRAILLRAPNVQHIVVEDWLLEHAPPAGGR